MQISTILFSRKMQKISCRHFRFAEYNSLVVDEFLVLPVFWRTFGTGASTLMTFRLNVVATTDPDTALVSEEASVAGFPAKGVIFGVIYGFTLPCDKQFFLAVCAYYKRESLSDWMIIFHVLLDVRPVQQTYRSEQRGPRWFRRRGR